MSKYRVLESIDHEIKILWVFYVKAFIIFVLYLFIFYVFKDNVNSRIFWLYMIFNIFMATKLIMPSAHEKRSNLESILIFLRKDNRVYQSVSKRRAIDEN